jgi:nucleolar protein 15
MSKKISLKKKEKSTSKELNEESKEEMKQISKKREIQKEDGISSQPSTGVVYVGHLPWGFIDSTLKKYFSQFGNITRIISPKSSKTGRSVGYAFIEFEDEETARIAAKTMNNYILFEKILKCSFVEDKKKYDRIFLKWKKKFEFKERYKIHCENLSKKKSNEQIKEMVQGLLDREEQRREKMKELGIKYEYKGFKEIVEEYKKEHMNEIKEKNKNRKNENLKEKEKENKKIKDNKKSKNKSNEKIEKEVDSEKEENDEEMEIEENDEEEENEGNFEESEENEEEEILKEKINKKSKTKQKEINKNNKIESIRKKRKLEEIKKNKKIEKIQANKKQIKKGKK